MNTYVCIIFYFDTSDQGKPQGYIPWEQGYLLLPWFVNYAWMWSLIYILYFWQLHIPFWATPWNLLYKSFHKYI